MALSKVDLANQVENQLPQNLVANNLPFRNIIINGDMSIAQRGTSVTGITSTQYLLDRMQFQIGSQGTWTMTQDSDVPTGQGFSKSLKVDCTTADASPDANDSLAVNYRMEGQNIQYLAYGTASAKSLTLSFWVKSNKTGTYINELVNTDAVKQISKSYTISSADTWEKKTMTFAGDTVSGFTNDNNLSMYLRFYLGAGSNLTSGTLNTSWNSITTANRAVGQVNLADSTSNYINITGVQLEVGSAASDFEFLPVDVNLLRCQRYYQRNFYPTLGGVGTASTSVHIGRLVVSMRASPTLSTISGTTSQIDLFGTGTVTPSGTTFSNQSTNGFRMYFGGMTGSTFGQPSHLDVDSIQAVAEL